MVFHDEMNTLHIGISCVFLLSNFEVTVKSMLETAGLTAGMKYASSQALPYGFCVRKTGEACVCVILSGVRVTGKK